jgi:hypothetical protein
MKRRLSESVDFAYQWWSGGAPVSEASRPRQTISTLVKLHHFDSSRRRVYGHIAERFTMTPRAWPVDGN